MNDENKVFTISVGSDESRNGGLFGGCACASFKLTHKNLEIIKKQPWFDVLLDAMDPKKQIIHGYAT